MSERIRNNLGYDGVVIGGWRRGDMIERSCCSVCVLGGVDFVQCQVELGWK